MIEEALDSVKTTRYQIGTLSHLSGDIDHSLEGMRARVEMIERFLSSRGRRALATASIIIAVSAINYIRGWFMARFQP